MQQFTVPQFIDVEDKIIGPITTRQFVILLSAFLMIAACYKLLSFTYFAVVGLLIFAVSGTFAFLKVNGRPFHFFVLNLIQTAKKPGLRIWDHKQYRSLETNSLNGASAKKKGAAQPASPKHLSRSKLSELSLVVDTKGQYQGEANSDKMEINII